MINATIKMTVPPEKLKEVLQTLKALVASIRGKKGCLNCNCYVDVENENILFFKEEWQTDEDLDAHLRSAPFGILIGATKLLKDEAEIRFDTIVATAGAEVIRAARA